MHDLRLPPDAPANALASTQAAAAELARATLEPVIVWVGGSVASVAEPVKCCTCCGRVWLQSEWDELPSLGVQDYGDGKLDLRNCGCGGTMAMEVMP